MNPVAAGYPTSWYAATARGLCGRPALQGAVRADVCIIGAGYTGLSTALHLAQRGYAVVLLEGERVGWGAAGRNGGQIGSGQRRDEAELAARYGAGAARSLWELAEAAKILVRNLVRQHAIECDLKPGQLITAAKSSHVQPLRERAERLARDYGYADMSFVSAGELSGMLASRVFHGALLDRGAMHLHPLNFALGLALAAEAAGARIFEHSAVCDYAGDRPVVVRTAQGRVLAARVVLACDGYLGRLEPRIGRYIMPINNFIVATAPLGAERARALISDDVCVHDTRFVVNYFRLTTDHRLLFGGGENYRQGFPADIGRFVHPHLLRIFPQLATAAIDYAWGGALGISRTRLPHLGRIGEHLYFAQGYSGHGIATATLAGQLMAEAIHGDSSRFDVFARLPAPAWPGGMLLRWPLLVLGMLYYSLRDRL